MSTEWVDRQPYYGEVVDQGLSQTKNGKINLKIYVRIFGKVSNIWDPEKGMEAITPNEEIEVITWFDGDPKQLEYRLQDLQRMGFIGDDVTVLDPRHPEAQSFVGKKYLFSPNIKEGADGTKKIYWNPLKTPAKKRFVRDVELDKAGEKLSGLSAMINKMKEEKSKSKAPKEVVPF